MRELQGAIILASLFQVKDLLNLLINIRNEEDRMHKLCLSSKRSSLKFEYLSIRASLQFYVTVSLRRNLLSLDR